MAGMAFLAGIGLITLIFKLTFDSAQTKLDLETQIAIAEKKEEVDQELNKAIADANKQINISLDRLTTQTEANERNLQSKLYRIETTANSLENKINSRIFILKEKEKEIKQKEREIKNTIDTANNSINDLTKITKKIDKKSAILKKYSWLFDLLKNDNINSLKIVKDQNSEQSYFQIGELLFIWGEGVTDAEKEWTKITFNKRKFLKDTDVAVLLLGCDLPARYEDKKHYVMIKNAKSESFKCRLAYKDTLNPLESLKKVKFDYIAVGKASLED